MCSERRRVDLCLSAKKDGEGELTFFAKAWNKGLLKDEGEAWTMIRASSLSSSTLQAGGAGRGPKRTGRFPLDDDDSNFDLEFDLGWRWRE